MPSTAHSKRKSPSASRQSKTRDEFSIPELLGRAEADIKAGRVYGPFDSPREAVESALKRRRKK